MTRSATVVFTLLFFAAALLTLGAWAARRTHNAADFVLANRRLGVWFTALGYSANVLNAWMLLLMSAAAFVWGLAALWLWAAALFGCIVNLFYVAPRLRIASAGQGAVTVIQVLSADAGDRLQPVVVRSAVFITVAMLLLQTGVSVRAAGEVLVSDYGFDYVGSIVLCVAVVSVCIFAGGMRAAAASDVAQSVLLMVVGLLLLAPAMAAIGGVEQLQIAIAALDPTWTDAFAGKTGIVAIAFSAGGVGFGLAMIGQPQALNRFMAVRDEATLQRGRWIALVWAALLLAVVLVVGWAAHVLYAGLERPEHALLAIATRPLPPWLSAILVLAILAAIVLSIGSPLLVIASSLAADLKRGSAPASLVWLKVAVVVAAVLAFLIGVYAPGGILDLSLFAFTTLGAALGPLVLVRLSGKRIRPGSTLGAMWSAFVLSVLFHLLPDSPGDFLERVLPFVAALGIALTGGERRRNPDRADRAQETVHDRIPI
ncbi:MAG: sodium:solute symporter family transporter [Steroidobacter sp.]